MGTCYSCQSKESKNHSSSPMASENKNAKRNTPYQRNLACNPKTYQSINSTAAHNSFGFKFKHSVHAQPSNNSVRTYDKTSLKDDAPSNDQTANNDNLNNAPNIYSSRYGYRPLSTADVSNHNLRNDNDSASQNHAGALKTNITSTRKPSDKFVNHHKRNEMLKKQFLGTEFCPKTTSNVPQIKKPTSQQQTSRTFQRSSSQNSLSEKSNLNKNGVANQKSGSRPSVQARGLPRPNTVKEDGAKKSRDQFFTISYKAPARLTSLNYKSKIQKSNSFKSQESIDNDLSTKTTSDVSVVENSESGTKIVLESRQPAGTDSGMGSSLRSNIEIECSTSSGVTTPTNTDEAISPPLLKRQDAEDGVLEKIRCLSLDEPSVLMSKLGSPKSSERTDSCSQSSEIESRSDFLIDDEIADQPSLIVLNEPKSGLMTQSSFEPLKEKVAFVDNLSKDDSFANELSKTYSKVKRSLSLKSNDKKTVNHPGTASVIASHRQSLCSTLSSCSSINSDDLMMDFEADRLNDFEDDEFCRVSKAKLGRKDSTSSTIDELNQLVDSQKEPSMVRQKLATIRNRSKTSSSPSMTQSLIEMPRNRSLSNPLKPPRPIRLLSENESLQGSMKLDSSSFRSLSQDVTNVKTMLFRLKRLLHDSDTLNPFEANNWKNSVYQKVASFEAPHGLSTCQEEDLDQVNAKEKQAQENADLRRQIVFLEQQNADKDRTIKLLQQQMTKYTNGMPEKEKPDSCNAASQTTKMKSTISLDKMSPTTVSTSECNEFKKPALSNANNATKRSENNGNTVENGEPYTSKKTCNLPVRSVSACNIPRAPSSNSVPSISSANSSYSSICFQPSTSLPKNTDITHQPRRRSGAMSNNKLSSYSNHSLASQDNSTFEKVNSKACDKQTKSVSSSLNQPSSSAVRTGFNRNALARNSGRFLSLFKLRKNNSSSA